MLPVHGRDPVPSPEGRFIAYLDGAAVPEAAGEDATRVAVMRADGTGRRELTPAVRHGAVAWSPAGTLLAYTNEEGDHAGLEIVDVLTGERMGVGDYYRADTASSRTPLAIVWAPDGTRLAVGTATGRSAGFISMVTLERR
jgi:Tol biopolymer transport system component